MHQLFLEFSGLKVYVNTDWESMAEVLEKDFWSFKTDQFDKAKAHLTLRINRSNFIPEFPHRVASMQTQNAIVFDQGKKRFCDYYGELYSIMDFAKNDAVLFSVNQERTHEIAYLLILSRVGKSLDLKGLHKLHAFAISFNKTALVCMMSSKGGKSTLLAELLKDDRVKMISDDIPLIDSLGRVHAFPLKIGLNSIPDEMQIYNREENVYFMDRAHFGKKQLICTRGLEGRVEQPAAVFEKVVLVEAYRFNSPSSILCVSNIFKTGKGLFKHGVIGVGSPIVIEYFWQSGLKDFFVKTGIFFMRLFAFSALAIRAKRMQLFLGKNSKSSATEILKFLQNMK